jgi:hypothetical protein
LVNTPGIWQTAPVTKNNAPQQHLPESPPVDAVPSAPEAAPRPREIGGREGPDPTRYGDWEKGGRCIDF